MIFIVASETVPYIPWLLFNGRSPSAGAPGMLHPAGETPLRYRGLITKEDNVQFLKLLTVIKNWH
ncbi:rCG36321 [Rattus norvegicus]|uniref:RCG36321 n=1 Tax=Rattus norvegicus TaxID=10116 RepID=A6IPN1_RAT|nr:rCG36321 [Rattus norvegicus]